MAYVQVEADDVRIYTILLVLLQRLIFVHSNGSRKGQKLSSSNVLFAVSIRDYLTEVSSEQHSSAQTQGLQMVSPILPEVLELEIPTDVSVIFVQMLVCLNFASGYLSEETTQRKGTGGFWTVEYYQPYFDVDTKTVRFQLLFIIIVT